LHEEDHDDCSQSRNYLGDQIEKDLMGRACGTYGAKIKSYKVKGKSVPLQARGGQRVPGS